MTDYTYNIPNMTDGVDGTLLEIAAELPVFVPLLLLFTWGFIFLSGMSLQKRRTGYSDMPLWSTLSSLAALMIALALSINGTIGLGVLAIMITITVLSGVWLFLDKSNREI